MKPVAVIVGAKLAALIAMAVASAGCGNIQWPPGCTPGDYSCLPCTYQQSTRPDCEPFPSDAKKPKAQQSHGATDTDRR